nr:hypothetical protein DGKKSRWO_DGKKSRWO_CDS_0107 [uncultured phage]CAI9752284.1 hypothetical protein CVNMHQAP_CVNMHQAP_CDS_0107 [uncultured phage]
MKVIFVLISQLEIKLLVKTMQLLSKLCNSSIISEDDIKQLIEQLQIESATKYELCASIDTISYTFSIMLSEVRQEKREIMTAIFESKPKIAEEKSVLEKKLDAIPEYAKQKEKEEYLFNFINHLKEIKNNITWLTKDDYNEC